MARKNNITLRAADTVNAKEAEVYVTLNGHRYNCFHIKDLEVTLENKKTEVNVLRKTLTGHKLVSQEGKYKGTKFMVESEFRRAYQEFKESGAAPVYDIQIVNEDPTSPAGRQEIWLYDCMDDSLMLTKFDAEGETLSEDVEGTFDDWSMPEGFKLMENMQMN